MGPLKAITEFANAEFIKIRCFSINETNNETKHFINEIQETKTHLYHEEIVALIPNLSNNQSTYGSLQTPNILLLGLDSISRLNFERHFLRTKVLIQKKGFKTLFGYNKIGLNTFPNMYSFLTGNHFEQKV
jgi:hypothetical protein